VITTELGLDPQSLL